MDALTKEGVLFLRDLYFFTFSIYVTDQAI